MLEQAVLGFLQVSGAIFLGLIAGYAGVYAVHPTTAIRVHQRVGRWLSKSN